jgi:hypothetical protein
LDYFFLSVFCVGYAEIHTAFNLAPIEKEIQNSPKETIVFLDIANTLLGYPDAILLPDHAAWKNDWFQKHCPNITKEEIIKLLWIIDGHIMLTDTYWPELIKKAQNQGSKVIAFTIVMIKDPSFKGTISAGLLDKGLPIKDDLPELCSEDLYEYDRGVIATDASLKGPVLKKVLSQVSIRAEKIIFVDDRFDQIKSVDDVCIELGIPCIAFHYKRFKTVPELDEKIADYQLSTLVKEHRWVSDNDAHLKLEGKENLKN